MPRSTAILSRYAQRLFGGGWVTRPLRRARLRSRRCDHALHYCAAEVMEERALLSATFDGALSIGNGVDTSIAYDVAADAAGNSYVTGGFSGTVDFDPGAGVNELTALGTQDIFVAKYAPDNSLVWVQRMGGSYTTPNAAFVYFGDAGAGIATDGSGNVYVTGSFRDSGDFGGTTLTGAGLSEGFVAKLDAGGTVQWARSFGVADQFAIDRGRDADVDAAGNVYVTGTMGGGLAVRKYSSSGNLAWSRSFATNDSGDSGSVDVDLSGNLFIAGNFSGTVDFDPGPKQVRVNAPNGGAFALKLTTNGNFAWVAPFVGQTVGSTTGSASGFSVALDGSGNVLVGGTYSGPVDFNPGKGVTTLPTDGGGYIAKLNSSGGLVWARAIESTGSTPVTDLAVDSSDNIYATGYFSGTADFDPGTGVQSRTSAGGNDIFVVQLTSAGNFGWVATFGGAGDDRASGIALDPTGGIHLVGRFQDNVDFDPDALDTYYLTGPALGGGRSAFRLRLRQV